MPQYTLTDKAWSELKVLIDKSINGSTPKIRAAAKVEMLPYLEALQDCKVAENLGITWDAYCRDYLGSPASTFYSAKARQYWGPFGIFERVFRGVDWNEGERTEREMTATFC